MAWRRPGDKPLSEPMMVCLLTHICVTRPQWVNCMYIKSLILYHIIFYTDLLRYWHWEIFWSQSKTCISCNIKLNQQSLPTWTYLSRVLLITSSKSAGCIWLLNLFPQLDTYNVEFGSIFRWQTFKVHFFMNTVMLQCGFNLFWFVDSIKIPVSNCLGNNSLLIMTVAII